MGFLTDFKAFALRGNVVDMAVGVIIGGAFGKIVSSLVADVIMPPIGVLLGGVDFTDLSIKLKDAVLDAEGQVVEPEVVLNYGNFIQNVVDFLIIALVVLLMIRAMNNLFKKKEEPAPATPPAPTKDQELLSEIRDLLKQQQSR
jgi:large conductance mechanosensitive channel protein